MFNSYKPINNKIKTEKVLQKYSNSPDCDEFKRKLRSSNDEIDFKEYFECMEVFIREKKNKFGDIDMETDDQEATCNLCVSYSDPVHEKNNYRSNY